MNAARLRGPLAGAAALALAASVPLIDDGYLLSLAIGIVMYTALATSWALFSGTTRYISLATAAFFGVGMYVVGWGIETLPFPLLVLLAAVAGAAMSAVVGLATLRLSGVYFVIFTLGLAELTRQVMSWVQTTMGASSGLYVLTDVSEAGIYWQLLALAAIVFLVGRAIGRSRLGFALRIIGNDETVQPDDLVPGRHHGAARRRTPPVGPAARRRPLHAVVGRYRGAVPQPDDAGAWHRFPSDRLSDPAWHHRTGGGPAEQASHAQWLTARFFPSKTYTSASAVSLPSTV
jgi:hypothetical protein